MNTKNIREGEIVDNHKKFSEILEIPYCKGGKQRQDQINEIKRYIEFEKEPYKPYRIVKIYDKPLPKQDKRKKGNHCVYAGKLDKVLQYLWEGNKLNNLSMTQLGEAVGMFPTEMKRHFESPHSLVLEYEEKQAESLLKLEDLDEELISVLWGDSFDMDFEGIKECFEVSKDTKKAAYDAFFSVLFARFSRIFTDNLKRMQLNNTADYEEAMMLVYEGNKYKKANDSQIEAIDNLKEEIKREFEKKTPIKNNTTYKRQLGRLIKSEMFKRLGIIRTYKVYTIKFIEPKHTVTEQKFNEMKTEIKRCFYDSCVKTFYNNSGLINHLNKHTVQSYELIYFKNMLEDIIHDVLSPS